MKPNCHAAHNVFDTQHKFGPGAHLLRLDSFSQYTTFFSFLVKLKLS